MVDTTITEHCEEVITTTCQQVSTKTHRTSAIVGHDSKVKHQLLIQQTREPALSRLSPPVLPPPP